MTKYNGRFPAVFLLSDSPASVHNQSWWVHTKVMAEYMRERVSTINKQARLLLWLLTLLLTVALLAAGCAKKPAPKPLPGQPGGPTPRWIIGYYENPWPGTPDRTGSFPSMKTYAKDMNVVVPFWYQARADGTLDTKESALVMDTARQLGLKINPLVTNKSDATEAILGNTAVRGKVIDNIVKLLQERGFDGVNIDFEQVSPQYRDNLTAFMAELYPKVHSMGKWVIISVFPQVDITPDIAGAYNYAELAKYADYLQLMTYDHHWATSPPGAIAPIDWFEKNVKYAVDTVGARKVIVGIPAYGYDWAPGKDAETVRYVDAIVRAEQHGVQIAYDDAAQAPHFKYDGHEVWFENAQSTSAKLDVVNKYRPAGIAIWRLGQEQPEIWPIIEQKFPR